MSLQGSIHRWSDGIGYGAFVPADRAYYNVRTPTASARARRPSTATKKEYRRQNVTAGVDTHRSDISFGRATESVRAGTEGESRAREATKSLTSGEVGGFVWPEERAQGGDVDTILASSSSKASLPPPIVPRSSGGTPSKLSAVRSLSSSSPLMLSAHTTQRHGQAAQVAAIGGEAHQSQKLGYDCVRPQQHDSGGHHHHHLPSARSRVSSDSSGASTWRSDDTTPSSLSLGSSRLSSSSSSRSWHSSGRRSSEERHRVRRSPTTYTKPELKRSAPAAHDPDYEMSSRRGDEESRRRSRHHDMPLMRAASPTPRLPQFKSLDPVFDRHHKYDLIAEERAARGQAITGRFGPMKGSSVLAASLLTSELSTPWSHVLRGQKW